MPYGNLVAQEVQRYPSYDDLDEYQCTIEEREEYEPHIDSGVIIYAGVDYEKIIRKAEAEADIVLWDGGNNDFPFYVPDYQIVVADPHRPGHEFTYCPGETNVRMADCFVINKVDTADAEAVIKVRESLRKLNPTAVQIEGASPLFVDDPDAIFGKRVLVVEDGYLTVGGFNSFNNYSALFIRKLDFEGNTEWFNIVEDGYTLTAIIGGGILERTTDGNFIMVGMRDTIGISGNLDIIMIKFNGNGDVIWKKTHGTSTTVEGIYHITPTQDGGYIMCGIQRSFTTSNRFYVLKTDAWGNKEWDNTYSSNLKGAAFSVHETPDGYIIGGYIVNTLSDTDMFVVKTDKYGNYWRGR